jgi:hypothetical protein
MLGRFGIYDLIAVLIPGIFFLWAIGTLAEISAIQSAVPLSGGLAETSVLIVLGYVTGLLLQGISQQMTERALIWYWGGFPSARWLLPEDARFSRTYREELAAALLKKFGIVLELEPPAREPREVIFKRNQEIFYRCYRAVEKLSELPQVFNAQYGLFRSLLTTFVLLVVVSVCRTVWLYTSGRGLNAQVGLLGGLSIIGAIISYGRVTKRGEDFAKAVYDVFLANAGNGT